MAEGFVWRETRALAATSGEKPRALVRGVAGLLGMKKDLAPCGTRSFVIVC